MKTSDKKESANFQFFIDGIKSKTGIDIAVFSDKGSLLAGNAHGEKAKDCAGEVFTDGFNTYFPIKYKNKIYTGRLKAAGEAGVNYAYLISELAENFFFKEAELSVAEFYKAILFGELNYSQLRRYSLRYSVPQTACFAMIISVSAIKIECMIIISVSIPE